MLEVKDLFVAYGITPVLYGVSLNINNNEMVALLGSNGAGKSTLINTILGMIKPTKGAILFEGKNIEKLQPHEIVKRGIAQVPEARRIFPYMTVADNLLIGAYNTLAWSSRKRPWNVFTICSRFCWNERTNRAAHSAAANSR